MDEFRDEVEKIKHAPFKQRVEYFMDYYKWHVIGSVFFAVLIISFVYDVVTAKEEAFYALLLNSWKLDEVTEEMSDEFQQSIATTLEIDLEKESITLDSSMYMDYENQDSYFSTYIQKLVTYIATQTLDVIVTDETTFGYLVESAYFVDLYEYLSEEEIALYEDRFYYIDRAYYIEQSEVQQDVNSLYVFPEYDPTMKDDMEDPMAVGIYMSEDALLFDYYSYGDDQAVIGVVSSGARLEQSLQFLELVN